MAIEPAAISAIPAITTMEVFEMLPESPAASANGTVSPSAMPMITSRTNNPEVKWVSTSGGRCGCGCSSFKQEEIYHSGAATQSRYGSIIIATIISLILCQLHIVGNQDSSKSIDEPVANDANSENVYPGTSASASNIMIPVGQRIVSTVLSHGPGSKFILAKPKLTVARRRAIAKPVPKAIPPIFFSARVIVTSAKSAFICGVFKAR